MATSEKSLLMRLAKLGVSNFETIDDARQRQAEMLRRLEQAGIDPGYYVGLDDCWPEPLWPTEVRRSVLVWDPRSTNDGR